MIAIMTIRSANVKNRVLTHIQGVPCSRTTVPLKTAFYGISEQPDLERLFQICDRQGVQVGQV